MMEKQHEEQFVSSTHTHVWRKVKHLYVGNRIHRWGDDLEILSLMPCGTTIYITVNDGGTEKTWCYQEEAEVMCWENTA